MVCKVRARSDKENERGEDGRGVLVRKRSCVEQIKQEDRFG